MSDSRKSATIKNLSAILDKMERIYQIKDLHSLLDTILTETREFTRADAGSIFLVSGSKLKFSYVQNETLYKNDILSNKYIYANREIDINEKSIAGYVALTGDSMIIDDAYDIDPGQPYSFNSHFDLMSFYRTHSMLVVPLKTSKGIVVGVLELINALDDEKKIVPFTLNDKLFVTQFANYAGIAIERAVMLRDVVLRMIKLTELRDPEETQQHVNRVGSYAIEIYQRWADLHNVAKDEVNNYKDILRIAAMLHDVGKVGISDMILKKKGKLTEEEFEEIKMHTIHGARLFNISRSDWEIMAREITLNHHERWNGTGYPGKIDDIHAENIKPGPGKKGPEIPLSARIVCIADVYDALISARIYKDPWEEEKVLSYIKEQSGQQFDPELVNIFFEIYDIIKAIKDKYSAALT